MYTRAQRPSGPVAPGTPPWTVGVPPGGPGREASVGAPPEKARPTVCLVHNSHQ